MSIHWPIIKKLARHAHRPLVHDDQRSYRGAEMLIGALNIASAIEAAGPRPHVGILLPTGGAFPISALATWMLGRTVVPLNYLLKPDELRFVIEDSELQTIVTLGPMLEFMKHGLSGKPAEGADGGGGGAAGADIEHNPAFPPGVRLLRLEQLPLKSIPEPRWPACTDPDRLGLLLYTSGTSGKPKGVMLTHSNIESNIMQCRRFLHIDHNDVILGVLPQFHSFGLTVLTLLPLSVGAKSVFTSRFIPGKIIRLIREHRPTIFIGIPSMFNALLHAKDAKPEDFASLRILAAGGEPLPAAVSDAFRTRFGVTINEGYGLTETAPATNFCRPGEYRPHSVGMPLPGIRERIVDIDTGAEVPPGSPKEGEIRIMGPNVMQGYFKRPEETAAAFDDQGWFRTGDIGRIDAEGHLYITGRLKEMLIVGGENVFPREIEEVLNAHPAVKESGVIGRTDPVRGEQPIAFIELRDDPAREGQKLVASEKDLLAWCRSRLAGYKVPDEIRFIDALPRNPTGKVMRRELKKLL